MSRRSPFRQIDVTRAIRAALSAGIVVDRVEIDPEGRIVVSSAKAAVPVVDGFAEWKAKHDARNAAPRLARHRSGRGELAKPTGKHSDAKGRRWDVATDGDMDWAAEPKEERNRNALPAANDGPLRRFYDALGFDPATMGHEDFVRLHKAADERWRASIPGTPLGKRERDALSQLALRGVGVAVHWSQIKGCGSDTEDRLKSRGFIEIHYRADYPDQVESYSLTDAGFAAFGEVPARN